MSDRHVCEECGKGLATLGGLEIHMEMAHAAPPPEPEPMAAAEGVEPVTVSVTSDPQRRQVRPQGADGPDLTVPLAWVLVVLLFLGGLAAAIANPGPLG